MTAETSNAREDVRGLVAKLAAHVRPTCSELWDEAQAFLAAQQPAPPSAPVAADWITGDGLQGIKAEAHFLTQHKEEAVQRAGKRLLDRADKIIAALSQQPEARGGGKVEDGPIDASDNAEYIEHCADRLERCGLRVTAGALRVIAHENRTLAQQPAAPTLAKYQPCGCVICTCEDDYRCHGCGAKHCGNHTDHPPYVVQQPAAEEQLTYKGAPIGPMQTFADMERQVIAPVGAAEDMVLDAIERRESSAPVGVELSALRVQEWLQREYDILPPAQEIEQAMRTPCSCPDTERALAQPPEARGGGEVVAWMTPGGDVSRSFYWCLERCLPGQEEPQPLYAAPPSAPVGVEAFESRLRGRAGPFTAQPGERYVDADIALAVLREALAQQPAPSAPARPKVGLVRAGDGTYYAFEKGQSEQPAAVDEARGVVDVYTMQTIADAAAALDKRGDRQMAARLIRLHTRLLATQHQEPKS